MLQKDCNHLHVQVVQVHVHVVQNRHQSIVADASVSEILMVYMMCAGSRLHVS